MTKVSELTGPKLAEWTARAQRWEDGIDGYHDPAWWSRDGEKRYLFTKRKYRPDINGAQAMELVEKFELELFPRPDKEGREWVSFSVNSGPDDEDEPQDGDTPMEAVCRAVVASMYGEEVEDD